MNRRIIKRAQAKLDIVEAADYIARDNLEAAEHFIDAAEQAFSFLAITPAAGARRDFNNPALAGVRIWSIRGFDKHLIFYRETPDGLEIIRILHTARDIEQILGPDT